MLNAVKATTRASHHDMLTHQAQKLVGQTFYGTLMKQMHNSPFKSTIMDGGRGGQAFQPLMDQQLVDRMSGRISKGKTADPKSLHAKKGLVQSIVSRLERSEASKASPIGPTSGAGHHTGGEGADQSHQQQQKQQHLHSSFRQPSRPNPLPRGSRGQSFEEMRSHVAPGLRA